MAQAIRTQTVEKAILDAMRFALTRLRGEPEHVTGELASLLQVSSTLGLQCTETVMEAWNKAFDFWKKSARGLKDITVRLTLPEDAIARLDERARIYEIDRRKMLKLFVSEFDGAQYREYAEPGYRTLSGTEIQETFWMIPSQLEELKELSKELGKSTAQILSEYLCHRLGLGVDSE
jgi:hypothetical protein